ARADGRIGHVLGRDRADAGPSMRAAAGNADARRGDRHTEHAGAGTASGDGEGHLRLFPAFREAGFEREADFARAAGFEPADFPSSFAMRSSGMTANTSISIRYSGRASPWITRPVDTGNTPFSHLPIARYTASR